MTTANDTQVGGDHYRAKQPYQHWDYVYDAGLGYMEAQITKYISRHKHKNGLQDLQKAKHFVAKLREQAVASVSATAKALGAQPERLVTDQCTKATIEWITRNCYEGSTSAAIMYTAGWRSVKDLTRVRHYIELLMEDYGGEQVEL